MSSDHQEIELFPPSQKPSTPLFRHQIHTTDSNPNIYLLRKEPSIEQYKGKEALFEVKTFGMLMVSFFNLFFTYYNLFSLTASLLSTIFCFKMQLAFDMPISLYSVGLFFPISFGINWTISRRESLLQSIADLKSSLLDLYFCVREWAPPNSNLADNYKVLSRRLLSQIKRYAMHEGVRVDEVYDTIGEICLLIEVLRKSDDWIRSAISRAYQYRRFIVLSFEKIRVLHDYRTPSTLRAYGMVMAGLCPILFGPFFAKVSIDYGYWAGIFSGLVTSLLVSILNRIYTEQEDPCDSSGRDDLNLDVLIQTIDFMY